MCASSSATNSAARTPSTSSTRRRKCDADCGAVRGYGHPCTINPLMRLNRRRTRYPPETHRFIKTIVPIPGSPWTKKRASGLRNRPTALPEKHSGLL
jgi:hypothetical protein